jgi:hypothetical protein
MCFFVHICVGKTVFRMVISEIQSQFLQVETSTLQQMNSLQFEGKCDTRDWISNIFQLFTQIETGDTSARAMVPGRTD